MAARSSASNFSDRDGFWGALSSLGVDLTAPSEPTKHGDHERELPDVPKGKPGNSQLCRELSGGGGYCPRVRNSFYQGVNVRFRLIDFRSMASQSAGSQQLSQP